MYFFFFISISKEKSTEKSYDDYNISWNTFLYSIMLPGLLLYTRVSYDLFLNFTSCRIFDGAKKRKSCLASFHYKIFQRLELYIEARMDVHWRKTLLYFIILQTVTQIWKSCVKLDHTRTIVEFQDWILPSVFPRQRKSKKVKISLYNKYE